MIKVVLTSTLIATAIATIISSIITIYLKNLEYKNEYYKKVIEKRLFAYEFLETQVAVLKTTVLDEEDLKPYHFIFSQGKDEFYEFTKNLHLAISFSMWINYETTIEMENLNEVFYNILSKIEKSIENDIINIGKENYSKISSLRKKLEENVRNDLLSLYDLNKLKKPRPNKKRFFYIDK